MQDLQGARVLLVEMIADWGGVGRKRDCNRNPGVPLKMVFHRKFTAGCLACATLQQDPSACFVKPHLTDLHSLNAV